MEEIFINKKKWKTFSEEEAEQYVEKVFSHYRQAGFPYFPTDNEFRMKEVNSLMNYDIHRCIDEENKIIRQSMHGLSLCWSYHPYHYEIQCNKMKTVREVFEDDVHFRNVIRKRMKMGDNISDNGIRKMLKIYTGTQCVSNFRPTAAAAIYERFSKEGDTVLDMSSGFGGRALGAFRAGRKYIGFDPSTKAYNGVKEMCNFLSTIKPFEFQLFCRGSEESFIEVGIQPESIDLCFTSPPYFDCEKYSQEETQSFIKFPSKKVWVSGFLGSTFKNCFEVLKQDKLLLINIQNVKSFPNLVEETKKVALENGFADIGEWGLHLSGLKNGGYKTEPILIFQKRREI